MIWNIVDEQEINLYLFRNKCMREILEMNCICGETCSHFRILYFEYIFTSIESSAIEFDIRYNSTTIIRDELRTKPTELHKSQVQIVLGKFTIFLRTSILTPHVLFRM